mgnify:CR=1 FL=1
MPLVKGSKAKTKKGISENIKREKHAHPDMPIKQAVAISYSVAGKSKKKKKK